MRITRKGFTLVELLIVIGIIGVLGAMGLIGGKEANNIATATKIVEDFHIISAAMDMYYADNKSEIDKDGGTTIDGAKIATSIESYIKKDSSKIVGTAQKVGQFLITVVAATDEKSLQWWLSYLLEDGEGDIAKILANKAKQENFKKDNTSDEDYTAVTANKSVFYQVR